MAFMNQDREQLVAAVSNTKKQCMALIPLVLGIHQQTVSGIE